MHRLLAVILLGLVTIHSAFGEAPPPDISGAIVKIYTSHSVPDYQAPWSMRGTFQTTGSGCIIKGKPHPHQRPRRQQRPAAPVAEARRCRRLSGAARPCGA